MNVSLFDALSKVIQPIYQRLHKLEYREQNEKPTNPLSNLNPISDKQESMGQVLRRQCTTVQEAERNYEPCTLLAVQVNED